MTFAILLVNIGLPVSKFLSQRTSGRTGSVLRDYYVMKNKSKKSYLVT